MQYGIDLTKKIREAFQSARERQERVDEMRKRYYDSKHRPVEFAIGSLILVHSAHRRPGLSPKLAPRFEGPYRVLEKKSDVVYSVSHVELGKELTVHVQRMIPFYKSDVWEHDDEAEEHDISEEKFTDSSSEADPNDVQEFRPRRELNAGALRPQRSTAGTCPTRFAGPEWDKS